MGAEATLEIGRPSFSECDRAHRRQALSPGSALKLGEVDQVQAAAIAVETESCVASAARLLAIQPTLSGDTCGRHRITSELGMIL